MLRQPISKFHTTSFNLIKRKFKEQKGILQQPVPISPFFKDLPMSKSIFGIEHNKNELRKVTSSESTSIDQQYVQTNPKFLNYQLDDEDCQVAKEIINVYKAENPELNVDEVRESINRILNMEISGNSENFSRYNTQKCIEEFGRNKADTGSPEVQGNL